MGNFKKKDLLDSADLASLFNKSLRTITRWRNIGVLEKNKIGGSYYYHLDDIKQLILKIKGRGKK